jgi:hypothetical protein
LKEGMKERRRDGKTEVGEGKGMCEGKCKDKGWSVPVMSLTAPPPPIPRVSKICAELWWWRR